MHRFAALLVVLICLAAPPAGAREEIIDYNVDIVVETDGAVTVTENIRVRADRDQIRRGIFRDLPVRAYFEDGTVERYRLRILSVLRDGEPEPFFTEGSTIGRRIYIGREDVLLQPGIYTYTLTYEMTDQIGFFEGFDEVYWNVTGTEWAFPILSASARVLLPVGTSVLQTESYTGPHGATGTMATVRELSDRTVLFQTTAPLAPREGLTVAVGFTPGTVTEPSETGLIFKHALDNVGLGLLPIGFLGLLAYYVSSWRRVGRDPVRGTIIPLFEPPRGISPAVASYLFFRGFRGGVGGGKAMVAAIVSLAVSGRIEISEEDHGRSKGRDKYRLTRLSETSAGLPVGEAAIFDKLVGTQISVVLERAARARVTAAIRAFSKAISHTYGGKYFRHNTGWFVFGVVLSVLLVAAAIALQRPPENAVPAIILAVLGGVLGAVALAFGLAKMLGHDPGGSRVFGVFLTVLGVAVLLGAAALLLAFNWWMPAWALLSILLLPALNVAFLHALQQVLPQGQKVLEDIEGFRLYLEVAEKERLNLNDAPDLTRDLYERYLPYAIGLGVEEPWTEAFEAQIRRLGLSDDGYNPTWYRGSHWNSHSITSSTRSMSSGLGSGVASAVPSSSGSSGGGSSGGGGGGGGGGGW